MGIFDLADLFASSDDTSYGYKKLRNDKGYTNASLLAVLQTADSKKGKIIVSMAPKPGQIGGARDHISAEDIEEEDPDTLSNTVDSIPLVDAIIKVVESVL